MTPPTQVQVSVCFKWGNCIRFSPGRLAGQNLHKCKCGRRRSLRHKEYGSTRARTVALVSVWGRACKDLVWDGRRSQKWRLGLEIQRSSPNGVLHLNTCFVWLPREKSIPIPIPKAQRKYAHTPSCPFYHLDIRWWHLSRSRCAVLDGGTYAQRNTNMHTLHKPQPAAQSPQGHLWDFYRVSSRWNGRVYTGDPHRSNWDQIWPLGSQVYDFTRLCPPSNSWWTPFLSSAQAAPRISAESQLCSEREPKEMLEPDGPWCSAGAGSQSWLSDNRVIANI